MKKTEQSERPKLALFDFDGTLTKEDSFMAFLKHTHGIAGLAKHFLYLWPVLLFYKLKFLSNSRAKKLVFRQIYRNYPLALFQEKASIFCKEVLPQILNPDAMTKMQWHKQQGHRVIVVSAMFELVLQEWCAANNVELLATQLEIKNHCITGNFSTENCYGKAKVDRIEKAGLLINSPYVYAYGDSEGDQAMLALADEAFYQCF